MGVYDRDGINYSAMLQNAIANRNAAAQRQAQYLMNKGKLMGDTATKVGGILGRGFAQTYDELNPDEDEAELEKLKRERDAIIMAEQQRKANQEWASSQMEGYKPLSAMTPNMEGYEPNDAFLPKLQEHYDQDYTNPYSYAMMQDYYRRSR